MSFDGRSLTRKLHSFKAIKQPADERDCAQFLGRLLDQAGYEIGCYDFAANRSIS
jgi:hypothetical protein